MDELTENTPTDPAAAPAPAAPAVATQLTDTAAPPAAPAETAAPAASPETGEDAPATFGEAVTYEPTGDANLDLALAFVGKHGLGPEHPAIVAAGQGDFGQIKALLAEKGVAGYEAYVALAEQGYQAHAAKEAERTQAVQQILVQVAGSEADWEETRAWASANAEPDEKEAVNAALSQGGVVAEAMAAFLVNQYRAASGTTYAPTASAVAPEAARGATNPAGGALSPVEYGKAVAELRRTKGTYFEESPEYRQLQARRRAWRGNP